MENNKTPYEQYKAAKIRAGRSYVSEEEYYKKHPKIIETFDREPPKFLPLDQCKVIIKDKGGVYKSELTVEQIEALAKKYHDQEPPKKWFVVETK